MAMTLERGATEAHAYDDPDQGFGHLAHTASEMNLPGLNAEVFGGNIVLSPWSKGSYTKPMRAVVRQLDAHAPEGHGAGTEPLLFDFPSRKGALGPDIHVADVDLIDTDSNLLPGEALSLVGELTSDSTRDHDLTWKVDVYGRSGVAVYVLFDMAERQVTVYSEPSDKGYRSHTTVEFGKPVHVPAPFDFELDTTAFERER